MNQYYVSAKALSSVAIEVPLHQPNSARTNDPAHNPTSGTFNVSAF